MINWMFGIAGWLLTIAGIVGIGLMIAGGMNETSKMFRIGFWVALPAMVVLPLIFAAIPIVYWVEAREERRWAKRSNQASEEKLD